VNFIIFPDLPLFFFFLLLSQFKFTQLKYTRKVTKKNECCVIGCFCVLGGRKEAIPTSKILVKLNSRALTTES